MSLPHTGHWATPVQNERLVPPGEAAALLAPLRRMIEQVPAAHIDVEEAYLPILTLEQAYRVCIDITRQHSRSFFLSSQFLPRDKRRAVRAFYALCRTSDDLVDCSEGNADRALARWVALVQAPQPPSTNAVLLAWKDVATQYAVSQTLIDELLAGVAMDLTLNRYARFDDLWRYCYRVASVVGLVTMQIVGHEDGADSYAISLGVALQLTNILRDVGEDAARGRIYLPQEDLTLFGLCDDDILRGRRDERFKALMRFQIERAHALYEEAWPGIPMLRADSRFAIAAAAEVYRGILAKIVANDYDVYTRRAHISLGEKLRILPQVWQRLRRVV